MKNQDMISSIDPKEFWQSIVHQQNEETCRAEDCEDTPKVTDDASNLPMSLMHSLLHNSHFDQWLQTKQSTMIWFWEHHKAARAHQYETMELYMHNAMNQVKKISENMHKAQEYFAHHTCEECLLKMMHMMEQIPHHASQKMQEVFNQSLTEHAHQLHQDFIDPQMEKLMHLKQIMDARIKSWKENIVNEIDSPNFDWLEFQPISTEDRSLIHYTPRWPLLLHFTCAIICFGMSSIYHLMNSHSKESMSFFIKFDYAGICVMIAGSGSSPIIYSFMCPELEEWRSFYLCILWGSCLTTLGIMMIPYFDQDHFNWVRAMLFMVTGMSNLFPLYHILYHIDPQYQQFFHLAPWLIGAILYVFGATLYAVHFPEACVHNGSFDIFGHSHQLFHICIVVAALLHYYGSISAFHDRQLHSCPLPSIYLSEA